MLYRGHGGGGGNITSVSPRQGPECPAEVWACRHISLKLYVSLAIYLVRNLENLSEAISNVCQGRQTVPKVQGCCTHLPRSVRQVEPRRLSSFQESNPKGVTGHERWRWVTNVLVKLVTCLLTSTRATTHELRQRLSNTLLSHNSLVVNWHARHFA